MSKIRPQESLHAFRERLTKAVLEGRCTASAAFKDYERAMYVSQLRQAFKGK